MRSILPLGILLALVLSAAALGWYLIGGAWPTLGLGNSAESEAPGTAPRSASLGGAGGGLGGPEPGRAGLKGSTHRDASARSPFSTAGIVLSAVDRAPIPHALVALRAHRGPIRHSLRTGPGGRFTIENLSTRLVGIHVTAEGFPGRWLTVPASTAAHRAPPTEILLRPYKGTLVGTVRSRAGAPIPNAHISWTRDQAAAVQTDHEGHFELPLPGDGYWQLIVSAAGYLPLQRTLNCTEVASGFRADAILTAGRRIAGKVVVLGRRRVPRGTTVFVDVTWGDEWSDAFDPWRPATLQCSVGADGAFEAWVLNRPSPSNVSLTAVHVGVTRGHTRQSLTTWKGSTRIELPLNLPPASPPRRVAGQPILGSDGEGLAGCWISDGQPLRLHPWPPTRTDEGGGWDVTCAGTDPNQNFYVETPGGNTFIVWRARRPVQLPALGAVEGRVQRPDGAPGARAWIELLRLDGRGDAGNGNVVHLVTPAARHGDSRRLMIQADEQGRIERTPVPAGTYRVLARPPGDEQGAADAQKDGIDVIVTENNTTRLPNLVYRYTHELLIHARSEAGTSLAADVGLSSSRCFYGATQGNKQGIASLFHDKPDVAKLTVSAAGYYVATKQLDPLPQRTDVTLRPHDTLRIKARLRRPPDGPCTCHIGPVGAPEQWQVRASMLAGVATLTLPRLERGADYDCWLTSGKMMGDIVTFRVPERAGETTITMILRLPEDDEEDED